MCSRVNKRQMRSLTCRTHLYILQIKPKAPPENTDIRVIGWLLGAFRRAMGREKARTGSDRPPCPDQDDRTEADRVPVALDRKCYIASCELSNKVATMQVFLTRWAKGEESSGESRGKHWRVDRRKVIVDLQGRSSDPAPAAL